MDDATAIGWMIFWVGINSIEDVAGSRPIGSALVKREQDAIRDNFETDFLFYKTGWGW